MNLKVLKLKTGEEIITELLGEQNGIMTIARPVVAIPTQQGLSIIPLLFSSEDEEFEIDASNILLTATPTKNMQDTYAQAFSNITLPQKNKTIIV